MNTNNSDNSTFVYNPPMEPFLEILYEDDKIVVVNKPSGILSVPGKAAEHNDSILSRVRKTAPDAEAVHRLDMSTSGIIVVAKNKDAAGRLGKQFQERQTRKLYYAWVWGVMTTEMGRVNKPLCVDWLNRPMQRVDYVNGREAITDYICIARESDRSFVRLHPHTGRSHQLRVHMKELGHPILGDHLYAPAEARDIVPHLQLHAGYLAFHHPKTMELMEFNHLPPFKVPDNFDVMSDKVDI